MLKKKREGETLKQQLRETARDRMYHFMLADESVRGLVLNGTRMIKEMRWNHELGLLETLVLGHAYLGVALMSGPLKGNDRIALEVACSGPIKGFTVEANAFGEIRGFLKSGPIPIDKPLESFDLSAFYGAGFLSVTKYLEDAKSPFTGTVMLEKGNLAQDLVVYHHKSEQIPTAISLSVVFDKSGEVQGAGGLLLQALPGADPEVLYRLEERVPHLEPLGRSVQDSDFPQQWLERSFGELKPRLVRRRSIAFICHCGPEKIESMLVMLPEADLRDMAQNGPFPVHITCHHCNTVYAFGQDALAALLERRVRLH